MVQRILIGLFLFIMTSPVGLHAQSESCKASFSLGPDQLLCFPQTDATVVAETSWEILSLDWVLPPGASLQDELTAAVTTTGMATLSATASLRSPNLLVNGDFSAGNTGFTSQLIHSPITILPPNTYAITTNPASIHPDFKPCSDHTSGTGRMLAANGNIQPNRNVWCQTVPVEPGVTYELSFWAAALTENGLAELVWRIDGQNEGQPLVPGPVTCEWVNRTITWTSGVQTSAQVCVHNLQGANSGNDFAIDDLSMVTYCTVNDTVTITHQPLRETNLDTLICQGQSVWVGGQEFSQSILTTITLEDALGCDSLVHLDLVVVDPALAVAPPSPLNCRDREVTLQAEVGFTGPGQLFQWLGPGGQSIPGGTGPSLAVDAPGDYTLLWTVQSSIGSCSAAASVTVGIDTLVPLANAGADRALTCNAPQVEVQAQPGGMEVEYLWSNLDGPDPVPGPDGTAVVTSSGRIMLEVSDPENGCISRDTMLVTDLRAEPDGIVMETTDPFCSPETGVIEILSVGAGLPPFQFRLAGPQGLIGEGSSVFSGLGAGTYTLTVTDAQGCSATRELVLGPMIDPEVLLPGVVEGDAGESVQVTPTFNFPASAIESYRWTAGGAVLDCEDCPLVQVSGLGEGWLKLCVTLGADCERCAESRVSFEEGAILYLPDAFSPNGDGINDLFGPFPAGQVVRSFLSMRVFDRWGGLVFEWLPQGGGTLPRWDGFTGSRPADPGVFVYVLEAELVDGQLRRWQGDFSLIR